MSRYSFTNNLRRSSLLGGLCLLIAPFLVAEQQERAGNLPDGRRIPWVGVDTAGTYFQRDKTYRKAGWNYPAFRDAVAALKVDFLMDHYLAVPSGRATKAENLADFKGEVADLSSWLKTSGMQYIWDVEEANFVPRKEYEPGVNFYEPEPGLHYVRLPSDLIEPLTQEAKMRFVCYDEFEHMIITRNFLIKQEGGTPPSVAETAEMNLEDSYEAIFKKLVELRKYYAEHGITPVVEMVWPDLHHIFARAGWTISPKLMKESWNPLVAAMGLGAAIQYEKQGADLWFNPDLWFTGNYPGHSVGELQSSLWLAHWLGATRLYVENLDYTHLKRAEHNPEKAAASGRAAERTQGRHHPDADGVFGSLVNYQNADQFSLTRYGDVLRQYAENYRFNNPRPYTWRDARCDIAIVRFPDSCWGQGRTTFPDTLLGSKISKSSPETEAWFMIWNLLSNGTIPQSGISFFTKAAGNLGPRFFCPMPPVLVFDHRIGDEQPDFDFRGAKVVFLTGVDVTPGTLRVLNQFVETGGVCIALANLAPEPLRAAFFAQKEPTLTQQQGKGTWLVTKDFAQPQVRNMIKAWLPPSDEMRFQFGDHRLVLRKLNLEQVQVELDGKIVAKPETIINRNIVLKNGVLVEEPTGASSASSSAKPGNFENGKKNGSATEASFSQSPTMANIAYLGPDRDETMDAWLPLSAPKPAPAVLLIHGGGWYGGDKADHRERNIAATLSDNGYAVFSINYMLNLREKDAQTGRSKVTRLAWPQSIYDCKSALRYIRANAARFNVDPARIAVMGGSAGGHLAMLVGATANQEDFNRQGLYTDQSNAVSAVIDFYGDYDIRGQRVSPFEGATPEQTSANEASASPVSWMDKRMPPMLIVHGTADNTISVERSRALVNYLQSLGVEHQYVEVEGAPHGFYLHPPQKDLRPEVLAFLKKYIGG